MRSEPVVSGSGPVANQECTVSCPPTTTAPPVTDSTLEGEKGLDILMGSPPKNYPNITSITSHDQEKEKKEDFITRMKQGWTLANVESLKIGELYLIVIFILCYIKIKNIMLIFFIFIKCVFFRSVVVSLKYNLSIGSKIVLKLLVKIEYLSRSINLFLLLSIA